MSASVSAQLPKEAPPKRRWLRRIFIISACFPVLILAAIMIPCFVGSRTAANESAAVGSLRALATAQVSFSEEHPAKGFAISLADLGPTLGTSDIDSALANGTKSGYTFALTPGTPDRKGHITRFAISARPQVFEKTGYRSFFTDESGVIRYTSENRPATASDSALQ